MTTAAVAQVPRAHRSNVFIAAVVQLGGALFPVRIRNLSATGALVDGKDLPPHGAAVRLQRGPHSVAGRVIWSSGAKCGLAFDSPVPAQEWIAYGSGHKGQQRVDEIIASVRSGEAAGVAGARASEALSAPGDAAAQIDEVGDALLELAAELAAIPAVVDQGLETLQKLDIARQKLTDLAVAIRGGGPAKPTGASAGGAAEIYPFPARTGN